MTFATNLICNILKVFLILHSSHLHCHTFHALALHLHYHHVRIQHLLHKLVVCSMVAPFVLVLHPIIMADYSTFATNLMVSIICFSFYRNNQINFRYLFACIKVFLITTILIINIYETHWTWVKDVFQEPRSSQEYLFQI